MAEYRIKFYPPRYKYKELSFYSLESITEYMIEKGYNKSDIEEVGYLNDDDAAESVWMCETDTCILIQCGCHFGGSYFEADVGNYDAVHYGVNTLYALNDDGYLSKEVMNYEMSQVCKQYLGIKE